MDEDTVPPYEGGTTGGSPPRHAQPPLNPLLPKEGKLGPLAQRKKLTRTPVSLLGSIIRDRMVDSRYSMQSVQERRP